MINFRHLLLTAVFLLASYCIFSFCISAWILSESSDEPNFSFEHVEDENLACAFAQIDRALGKSLWKAAPLAFPSESCAIEYIEKQTKNCLLQASSKEQEKSRHQKHSLYRAQDEKGVSVALIWYSRFESFNYIEALICEEGISEELELPALRFLLEASIQEAKKEGVKRLHAHVFANDKELLALYRAEGFKVKECNKFQNELIGYFLVCEIN